VIVLLNKRILRGRRNCERFERLFRPGEEFRYAHYGLKNTTVTEGLLKTGWAFLELYRQPKLARRDPHITPLDPLETDQAALQSNGGCRVGLGNAIAETEDGQSRSVKQKRKAMQNVRENNKGYAEPE